ncbi:DUF1285 domain-containing protein [Methylobrevis pamukkalensis]|uniref:DUF1285 domain-containing protein n=1 Tax=Methylobrevis pamukkalensis TaxID=1439726 RepID=A0A1E3H5K2_9HYPH|nr:hypothetical protein A6302_01110 [Methylobrevis pamukkalensis]
MTARTQADDAASKSGEDDDRLAGLAALLSRAAPGHERLAPVERWTPPECGAIDMRIDANGGWHYMGSPIGREALVRLFSTVLMREGDRYLLVTPAEKLEIAVDDVPFLGVEMHVSGTGAGQRIVLRTNLGDVVEAGPEHRLRAARGEPSCPMSTCGVGWTPG